jgi:cytochrome c-type biogenesis protein CcmH/NrfF
VKRVVVAAAFAALALAASAVAAGPVSASAIETKLVCPVCHETLDQSNAPVAQEMKHEIRRRIAQGWSEKQIIDEMVANFGPGVLSTPAKHGFDLLAWALPLGGIALGAGALGLAAWRWSRRRARSDPDEPLGGLLSAEDERLVDRELARFE